MKNFYILTDAVNFIEENICEEINCQMIADYCCVSLSSLQKLFRLAMQKSIKEYIRKRRISLAAEDILKTNMSFIEIAYRYQFSSPEVFCRAFRKVWNDSPSSYKNHWRFSGIFPKIDYHYEEGADQEMARKKVDITDAYETFKSMQGTYVICFDIVNLTPINNISREAGDLAIIEAAKRIDEAREDNMLMFRIGGDEFALVSDTTDLQETEKLAEKILCRNGEKIVYENQRIALSLRAGFTKIPQKSLRYSEFFTNMHQSIEESRNKVI
ncbi:MAG: helix-turn-helix domain-containing protein [Vallitaleaceae bacterium]|nr:helix-turn-helix domain-containing protein [Vallitaleaceae bacterium]